MTTKKNFKRFNVFDNKNSKDLIYCILRKE